MYENAQYWIIITGAMIGIINSVCVVIFEQVPVYFEKCLTYADETLA